MAGRRVVSGGYAGILWAEAHGTGGLYGAGRSAPFWLGQGGTLTAPAGPQWAQAQAALQELARDLGQAGWRP